MLFKGLKVIERTHKSVAPDAMLCDEGSGTCIPVLGTATQHNLSNGFLYDLSAGVASYGCFGGSPGPDLLCAEPVSSTMLFGASAPSSTCSSVTHGGLLSAPSLFPTNSSLTSGRFGTNTNNFGSASPNIPLNGLFGSLSTTKANTSVTGGGLFGSTSASSYTGLFGRSPSAGKK